MEETVESYLNSHYRKTNWPYFNYMKIKIMFGNKGQKELTKLREEGKITGTKGCNGTLIQLLITEDGEII